MNKFSTKILYIFLVLPMDSWTLGIFLCLWKSALNKLESRLIEKLFMIMMTFYILITDM